MFDIGWSELLVIAVVAVVVVGPRELPGMLRTFGKYAGQVRRMAGDFQRQFNDALKEAELDEVRKGIETVRSINPLNEMKDSLNPLKQAGDSVRKAIEDPGAPRIPAHAEKNEDMAGAAPKAETVAAKPAARSTGKSTAKSTGKSAAAKADKPATPKKPAAPKKTAAAKKPAAPKKPKPTKSAGNGSANPDTAA